MIFVLFADLRVFKKSEHVKYIYELSTKNKQITAKCHSLLIAL